jgi:predicted HTH transcriptional regulator
MGYRGIGKPKRDYHSKAEFLLFVDQQESITQAQVQTEFGLRPKGAKSKIYRMWEKGFLEPLGIEAGKWVLSHRGLKHLEYLKEHKK